MSASRRESTYLDFDFHKKIIFVLFVPISLEMYSIVPFSKIE